MEHPEVRAQQVGDGELHAQPEVRRALVEEQVVAHGHPAAVGGDGRMSGNFPRPLRKKGLTDIKRR